MMYRMLFFDYTPNILKLINIYNLNHDHFARNRDDLLPPPPFLESKQLDKAISSILYKFGIWNGVTRQSAALGRLL